MLEYCSLGDEIMTTLVEILTEFVGVSPSSPDGIVLYTLAGLILLVVIRDIIEFLHLTVKAILKIP